jgi:7,8-dihydropterin-6-yl-methyl-4-(beta-D-ribofuranosyl)aminobenzene 5'-phosphate synthase
MEIFVLCENEPGGDDRLRSEHGLSLLVLAHGRRVLFDTGSSGAFASNADALGLGDALAQLDAVVLSHGHYDHTGGLAAVLTRTRRPTPVHVRPGFFRPRLSTRTGEPRTVGVPIPRAQLEDLGARFVEEGKAREFLPGFWLTGEIPLREELNAGELGLQLGASMEEAVPDPFTDEQAMGVGSPAGLAVLVGCAHRGLVNSIQAAKSAAGAATVQVVLGGAHLRSAGQTRIDWCVRRTRELLACAALGHCTGAAAEAGFADIFGPQFRRLRTGWRWASDAG